MKSLAFFTLCLAALLSGCESMSSRVHERFSTVAPQTRIFAADRRAVYAAGQTAVKNVGLLLGHTSLAEGRIDAYAPIRSGDLTRDTRQTTLEIRLTETDGGETEVALLVSVVSEGDFPGGVSRQAMREHSLYEMYFGALQQVLVENGALKTSEKP
jgi:hypothetical protein